MADIETTLSSLNPMDFVTGMRKGLELGSTRAKSEQDIALAGTETIKAAEFASAPNTQLRALQTETGQAQQQLAQALYGIQQEVATRGRADTVEGQLQQIGNVRTAAGTRGITLGGEQAREPGRQAELTALASERATRLPAIVEEQQLAAQFESTKNAAARGDFEANRRVMQATRAATTAIADARGDPANANLHPYEVADKALANVTDPWARAVIQEEKRKVALTELQRSGNNLAAVRTWLPRVMPGADVRLRADGNVDIGFPVQRRVRDPGTGEEVMTTVLDYTTYSNDPNAGRSYIGTFIDEVSGAQRPFVTPTARAGAAATTTPAQDAAAIQGPPRTAAPAAAPRAAPVVGAAAAAVPPIQLGGPPPATAATVGSALVTEPPSAAAQATVGGSLETLNRTQQRQGELQQRHAQLLGPGSATPTPETWKEVGIIELELKSLQGTMDQIQKQLQAERRGTAGANLRATRTGYAPPAQ